MTASLARLLRQSISNEDETVLIGQEIQYVKSYLTIQKMRYKDKLEFEINVDPSINSVHIVKLVLQPIVENAIYHGVKEKRGQGIIEIKGWKENNKVYITVSDNGTGIPKEKLIDLFSMDTREKESAFGLFNIQQRLQIYFGKEYGLHLESKEGQGTIATVCLPVGFKKEIEKNESISG